MSEAMASTMTQERRELLLNSVRKGEAVDVNEVHMIGRLLRLAIARSGLSHKEAMDALGVEHKSEFSEMLDGKRKLWVHQLLRPEASEIWRELVMLRARQSGYAVERVIRWTETA